MINNYLSNGNAVILGMRGVDKGQSVGHAVAGYRIQDNRVYVYDSNTPYDPEKPGDEIRYIEFNESRTNWKYSSVYESGTDRTNLNVFPLSFCTRRGTAPWNQPDGPQSPGAILFPMGTAQVAISDSEGKTIGYRNGEFVDEISDAVRLISYGDLQGSESYFIKDTVDYTVNIMGMIPDGEDTGEMNLDIFGNRYMLQIKGLEVTANTHDAVTYGKDGRSLAFTTNDVNKMLWVVMNQEAQDYSRAYSLNKMSVSDGEQVTCRITNNDNFELVNNGVSKTYGIAIEQAGYNPGIRVIDNISVGPNERQVLVPSNWGDLGNSAITIYVDTENDGTIDYEIVIGPRYSWRPRQRR